MSDTNETQSAGTTEDTTAPQGGSFEPITSQEDLDRIVGTRLNRERAKYADYDEIKTRLAEIDEASQTEAEKAAKKLADAEARAAKAEATALRAKVQATHGISDEDADLFLTANDAETLEKQAKALADRAGATTAPSAWAPREGTQTPPPPVTDERALARSLFGNG